MSPSDLGLGSAPWIVGHRGVAGEAPENSLDSLLLALEQRVDMVELDLQLTADGELVACHDWTLERMGGVDLTLEKAGFNEISAVEISGPFREESVRRVVATLGEILTLLPSRVPLNLELKRRRADAEVMVGRLLEEVAARGRLLISSFDWDLLAEVKRQRPELPLAPLGGSRSDPADLLQAARDLGAWSVHCRDSLVDPTLVSTARDDGRPLLVYTVNEADNARDLFDRGVEGVFSDFPGRLRDQLSEGRGDHG